MSSPGLTETRLQTKLRKLPGGPDSALSLLKGLGSIPSGGANVPQGHGQTPENPSVKAPKTQPGAPFTTCQAADEPGKPLLSSPSLKLLLFPISWASPALPLILTVASTFPSPSHILPAEPALNSSSWSSFGGWGQSLHPLWHPNLGPQALSQAVRAQGYFRSPHAQFPVSRSIWKWGK